MHLHHLQKSQQGTGELQSLLAKRSSFDLKGKKAAGFDLSPDRDVAS
jgi:hypothetical protein